MLCTQSIAAAPHCPQEHNELGTATACRIKKIQKGRETTRKSSLEFKALCGNNERKVNFRTLAFLY